MMATSKLRVGVIADFLEEGWPSMDLVAEMLMLHLQGPVAPVLLRPALARRLSKLAARNGRVLTSDRIINRFWDYPRWLRTKRGAADVFHLVDHSYAHLATELPQGRIAITCHDTDAFRPFVEPPSRESKLPRFLSQRILDGLRRADVVACVSESTRSELVGWNLVAHDRTVVVPNGVHPCFRVEPDEAADRAAGALLGSGEYLDVLHVGSTIPRKRIDVLIQVVAALALDLPALRLLRVGGPFTPAQQRLAQDLAVADRIVNLPFVDRPTLAALYRRAVLVLLPSEREGFGLPVIEALASGTPIVATDLPVLREVGATAASYAPLGDIDAWRQIVLALLDERSSDPASWAARRIACARRGAEFSWRRHAAHMIEIYEQLAGSRSDADHTGVGHSA